MAVDFSAIARWPNVPACYGWLSLDRRGQWRLQGEPVTHRGLIDFMNRQYTHDEAGNWFVQNGPQRVFVELAYAPWVYRLDGNLLVTHTGAAAGELSGLFLDDEGSLLIAAATGPGVLDDRDLARWLERCRDAAGCAVADECLVALAEGRRDLPIFIDGHRLQHIAAAEVPERFGFERFPHPC